MAAPGPGVGSGPCKHHPRTWPLLLQPLPALLLRVCVTTRATPEDLPHTAARNACQCRCDSAPSGAEKLLRPVPQRVYLPVSRQRVAGPDRQHVRARIDGLHREAVWLFLFLKIIAYGYLFSFMQNIIHATANEEEQMPDLPGVDDVLGGAFRLTVTVVMFWRPITCRC